jgi:hypothetical protein
MDPDALLERHLEQAKGIRVAEVRLDAERLLRESLQLDAEPLAKPFALEPLELRAGQRLELGLEDRHAGDYSLLASADGSDQGADVRAAFSANQEAGMTYFLEVLTLASPNAEPGNPGACRRR